MTSSSELPAWVREPVLLDLWERVAARLERGGLQVGGRVTVPTSEPVMQRAVGELLARRVTTDACRVDLVDLDARLRLRAGGRGVVEAAQLVLGRTLVDRPGEHARRGVARNEPFAVARRRLTASPLAGAGWIEPWLDAVRRDGLLARYTDPSGAVLGAVAVLEHLVGAPLARTDLAARALHDAHALDDGRPVTRLVLRAIGVMHGLAVPADAAGLLALWDLAGVQGDSVSSTCLTLGLGWQGDAPRVVSWRAAAGEGDPVHLSAWDLSRHELRLAPRGGVLVCENPRVLEAHAERFGGARAVVCTAGRPNLVVQNVLRACAASGASLRYHGDFDWAGIAIAHQVMDLVGAVPWRMDAAHYRAAEAFLPLHGRPVAPRWDAELGVAMVDRGLAVHEESVLDGLLDA